MKAWMRNLSIKITSKKLKKAFIFGENHRLGGPDLAINVVVRKYMSSLKDEAIVKISNLTYSEITQLIMGEFFDIEIFAGYRSAATNKIFEGGVLYISNKLEQDRTGTVIILCASNLVAKYGQSRINLTLNSGINLYSALNFICRRAGMPNSNVSTQLKKSFLEEVMNVNDSATSWIDKLCKTNTNLITNADSITGQTFSIFDANRSNNRVIKLDSNNILVDDYPQLTSDGLSIYLLPTFNFMCGDTIKVDNSILNISVENRSEISQNKGAYFSQKGEYMIYEMQYNLSNRNNTFKLHLKCKNRDRISSYIGG